MLEGKGCFLCNCFIKFCDCLRLNGNNFKVIFVIKIGVEKFKFYFSDCRDCLDFMEIIL